MKIVVLGLWHLGCVTAACCARHFKVTGIDFETSTVAELKQGRSPVLEPGLNDLLAAGISGGRLDFSTDPSACREADLLWLTSDTPVNEHDESDVKFVLDGLQRCLAFLPAGATVLISSQLPVGTCRDLESSHPQFHFGCSPENLLLGRAIQTFTQAERVIVGLRDDTKRAQIESLFAPFSPQLMFMRTESAEMVKHALNSFLACSITFINEIAVLCEQVGADAKEVSTGLKTDIRIGPKAYLNAGGPFAGGTLARDVVTLTKLAARTKVSLSLIPAIKESNDRHRDWAWRSLKGRLGELAGRTVAVLGLTYKANTDTLRRSAAVELCRRLLSDGVTVRAFDPVVKKLPGALTSVELTQDVLGAVRNADAVVVCTEWPEFRQQDWQELCRQMKHPVVVDANRFLERQLQGVVGVERLSVGKI